MFIEFIKCILNNQKQIENLLCTTKVVLSRLSRDLNIYNFI